MRRLLTALALLGGLGLASPAHALLCGTILSPLTVSATAVSFGDYSATDLGPAEASGTVTISCSIPLDLLPSFTVSLSKGSSATYAARTMKSGTKTLSYNLYTAADYAAVWGDGTGGSATQTFNGVLSLGSRAFTAYGRAPAGQWSGAGTYQDTIVVTVAY